jgi:hypothetical protein
LDDVDEEKIAAPQLKRLVAGFPPRRLGSVLGSGKWDLWWTKWCGDRFSPSTVPVPKPFIPLTSPSSQSPGADTQKPCDELITHPRSPADCPRSSNRNETDSFVEVAKTHN